MGLYLPCCHGCSAGLLCTITQCTHFHAQLHMSFEAWLRTARMRACSVMRSWPLTDPGGWLRIARWVGPPPLPTVPAQHSSCICTGLIRGVPKKNAYKDVQVCLRKYKHMARQ